MRCRPCRLPQSWGRPLHGSAVPCARLDFAKQMDSLVAPDHDWNRMPSWSWGVPLLAGLLAGATYGGLLPSAHALIMPSSAVLLGCGCLRGDRPCEGIGSPDRRTVRIHPAGGFGPGQYWTDGPHRGCRFGLPGTVAAPGAGRPRDGFTVADVVCKHADLCDRAHGLHSSYRNITFDSGISTRFSDPILRDGS